MAAEGNMLLIKQVLKCSRNKTMYSKDQDLQSFSELNFPGPKMEIT